MSLRLTSTPIFSIITCLNPKHTQQRALGHQTKNVAKSKTSILCINGAPIMEPATKQRTNYWDHEYLKSFRSPYRDETYKTRADKLKSNVRQRLLDESVDLVARLEFIDAIQRLGLGYHFKQEIKTVLDSVYTNNADQNLYADNLYFTALRFRLLRQHGHDISQDIFKSFIDEMGNFKACLCEDVKGILSLYEASHLGFEGETIVDEAKVFTTKHLKRINNVNVAPVLAQKVAHSLAIPLHWRHPRIEARWYIDIYGNEENMIPTLLDLAKLDYNMVQALYQKELGKIIGWWEDLGVEHLSFLRGKMMINFIWGIGVAFEPEFGALRENMSKVGILLTIIDDMYDQQGTLEELELFTEAVERWDVRAMEQLPQYMKICYMALFNGVNDISYGILKGKGYDITSHQTKSWVDLCKAYITEARWHKQGYTPTSKEYLDNAVYSVGVHMGLLNSYFLTTNKITKEELEYVETLPDLVYCPCIMQRLANDLGMALTEDTLKKSSIEIHMDEQGVSEDGAREHIRKLISDTWKKMNKARVSHHPFSEQFISSTTNLCQLTELIFMFKDGNVDPRVSLNNLISMVLEPIPLM